MDDARFDALTQRLGRAATRRHALWSLAGAAGLLASIDLRESRAKKPKKKKCKKSQKKCGKRCISKSACCGGCGELACCNGACVDLRTDVANCGVCGKECPVSACFNGVCNCTGVPDCPNPCTCSVREENNQTTVCIATITQTVCATDAQCPLGSACIGNERCATACTLN